MLILEDLLRARTLLSEMVRRELRARVSGTVLGRVWLAGRPALFALAYFLVFGFVFEPKLPVRDGEGGKLVFAFFLLSGLVPWMAFAEAVAGGASSIAGNADLLRKSALPPLVFPIQAVTVTTFVYFVPIVLLAAACIASGAAGWGALPLVVLWFALQSLMVAALAIVFGLMVAAFRDVEQIVGMLVGIGLFFAPIFYAVDHAPSMLRGVLWVNPFTPLANGYHDILVRGGLPGAEDALVAGAWLLGATALASVLYARGRDQVPDWL